MIKFTIPLPPVTKKNSQRILINRRTGKRFIAPSAKYEEYEAAAKVFVPKATPPIGTPGDKPVNVKCLFYMVSLRKCDLPNLLEAIDDTMVNSGLFLDDNSSIIAGHDGSRVLYDKEHPRTEVYIEEMERVRKSNKSYYRNCFNCKYLYEASGDDGIVALCKLKHKFIYFPRTLALCCTKYFDVGGEAK